MSPSITTSSNSPNLGRRKSKPLLLPAADRTDPLTLALQPPANESPSQRSARLHAEKLAKQRSDEIDRLLKHDDRLTQPCSTLSSTTASSGSTKKGRVYKMVLLGQAGAGKTTVLKQMRLLYDPQSHQRERKGWTRIVLLNLTASVRVLLQTVEMYVEQRSETKSDEMARIESVSPSHVERKRAGEEEDAVWVAHLAGVVELERQLRAELGAFGEDVELAAGCTAASRVGSCGEQRVRDRSPLLLRPGWQERLFTYARRSLSLAPNPRASQPVDDNDNDDDSSEVSSAVLLLRRIQPCVLSLWNDDARCRALRKRGMFLDGQSDAATSYFLDNFTRIVSPCYQPTDDDILHSRVRTLGVTEDTFRVDRSLVYRIYDVGGSRSQRTAWASFLDDCDSIIFLAPLSAFDQPLVEDASTNRLADTFSLFNSIVSNPLLRNASLILFLNKIDLLEKKLKAGVKLQRYWPEYGGDNDFEAVWRWFRAKFRDCVRRAEDEMHGQAERRRLYVHTTVATSTVQIRAILMSVKDSILRDNLKVTGLVG